MLEHPLAKRVCVVDGQFAHGVKRPSRGRHLDTRDGAQPFHQSVASCHVSVPNLFEVLSRGVQCRFGRHLGQRWRGQSRHGKLHRSLPHGVVFGDHRANARATHAVPLGHAVDEHHVVFKAGKLHHRFGLGAVVAKLAVDLVSKQVEVVVFHQLSQCIEGLRRVHRACRVAGVAQQNGLGLVVDLGRKILDGRQGKSLVDVGRDGHHLHASHLGKAIVVGVKRLGNDDLITRIEARHEGKHQGL